MQDIPFRDLLSNETVGLLRGFCVAANRLILHSHDEERLEMFIIAAHREKAELEAPDLKAWLVKEGWLEEKALRVAARYEEGLTLLRAYDEFLSTEYVRDETVGPSQGP